MRIGRLPFFFENERKTVETFVGLTAASMPLPRGGDQSSHDDWSNVALAAEIGVSEATMRRAQVSQFAPQLGQSARLETNRLRMYDIERCNDEKTPREP